jgi:hypothetical protein
MNATQPIGVYRDSVHEVVLGRAGPYGFIVSLVVVTLGLYGLRGAPRSADVVALILGGAFGVAIAGTLGLRRRGRVSSHEELPETWLDFHPLAVALSAAAGIAAGSAPAGDTAGWVVGSAVAGVVYVLVAAGELAFRRQQSARYARRAREAGGMPVALGTGVAVGEWRRARQESIDALVQLDAPPGALVAVAAAPPAEAEAEAPPVEPAAAAALVAEPEAPPAPVVADEPEPEPEPEPVTEPELSAPAAPEPEPLVRPPAPTPEPAASPRVVPMGPSAPLVEGPPWGLLLLAAFTLVGVVLVIRARRR